MASLGHSAGIPKLKGRVCRLAIYKKVVVPGGGLYSGPERQEEHPVIVISDWSDPGEIWTCGLQSKIPRCPVSVWYPVRTWPGNPRLG